MTAPALRQSGSLADSQLALPGTNNVRDLVGYPTAGGSAIGPGRLLRGEVLVNRRASEKRQGLFDSADADEYAALGLSTIIDLRSVREVELTPSAWPTATGAEVVQLPIEEGGEGSDTNYVRRLLSGELEHFTLADMTAFYVGMLERQATTFAALVRLLGRPSSLPALVHCSAGKDRTGLAIALVLELVGTPRELVIEDYALTGHFRPDRVEAYRSLFEDAGHDPEIARVLFETPVECMQSLLSHLDATYGGAERYLVGVGGLKDCEAARLRDALLVPAAL